MPLNFSFCEGLLLGRTLDLMPSQGRWYRGSTLNHSARATTLGHDREMRKIPFGMDSGVWRRVNSASSPRISPRMVPLSIMLNVESKQTPRLAEVIVLYLRVSSEWLVCIETTRSQLAGRRMDITFATVPWISHLRFASLAGARSLAPVQCLAVAFLVPQQDVVADLIHPNFCIHPILPRPQLRASSGDHIPIPTSDSSMADRALLHP